MPRSRSAALLGGAALIALAPAAPAKQLQFQDPPTLHSENGVLALTLEAAPSEIRVKNRRATSNVYNGLYVPPVLRVNQGDTLEIEQVNHTEDLEINFHTHGIITSPLANGDNVLLEVRPGETF